MSIPTATLREIPEYLKPFIARQDYSLYTAMDHAGWRFILKMSCDFFKDNAHQKYIDGLHETGISSERIPRIEEMDACLQRFGWRAVAVNGFIPPAVFMEFQSLGILPIACEMRTLDHLAYTPAPDIVHEAAGHAPILADPEYAAYLKDYGEVSRKAIFSSEDMAQFEAIRNLSVVKEDPLSTDDDVARAEAMLDEASAAISYVSEAAELARMNWWTVEYGLVGTPEAPKIYGAGLLSSVGESFSCLKPTVEKRPLTVDCLESAYDITRPQPLLFITPDFQHLTTVLEEVAAKMAFRVGGLPGLIKALQAKTVTTCLLDTGISISGVLENFALSERIDDQVRFLKFSGPVQLAYRGEELPGQGPEAHASGFSTVLGRVAALPGKELSEATDEELRALNGVFDFEDGIRLRGRLHEIVRRDGRAVILRFEPCSITRKTPGIREEEFLFRPEWGVFDLACGSVVTSVYGGAADRANYLTKTGGLKKLPVQEKCNLTDANRGLNDLYARVRTLRENKTTADRAKSLVPIVSALAKETSDWLLRLEILELLAGEKSPEALSLAREVSTELDALSENEAFAGLIARGKKAYL